MRVLFSILLCCLALITQAQNQNVDEQIALQDINNLDSIIVDFANGTLTGNVLAVPLYIITDDDINALDFSFKMNETKVKVDTIIKNGTFEMTYFFNLNDRKLRLTSYSVSDYNTNKKILTIYFKLLQNTIDNKDVFEIAGFLNGDACPIKFTAKTFMITSATDEKYESKIAFYPNPTSDLLNITNGENMLIKIANNTGAIMHQEQIIAHEHTIKLSAFTPGVYYAIFESADGKQYSKSFIKN